MDNGKALVVRGSVMDIVQRNVGLQIADAFMDVSGVVIVDVSGSMETDDSRGGRTRYDVACEELALLQRRLEGRFLVLSFSDDTEINIGGVPTYKGEGTNLAGALRFAHQFDVADIKFFVISDGEPDSAEAALEEAARFKGEINCIYVGPESHPTGRDFLNRLAKLNRGQSVTADRVMELANRVVFLLEAGK